MPENSPSLAAPSLDAQGADTVVTPLGSHQVTLQPSGHRFAVGPQDNNILAAGLRAGLNLPYSCRAGHCRSCRGRVSEGSVDHQNTPLQHLSEAQRALGYALLCKATATSDVEIDIKESAQSPTTARMVPCRVKRIDRPAPDVAILGLRLPMNDPFRFIAGQFVDIQLAGGKKRSYSLASAPTAQGVVDLELHIRHTPGGLFTDHVFSKLKEGEVLRFHGPLGSFYLRDESDKPIIFIASGTGFAPVLSIVRQALASGNTRPMVLYWGGRTEQDLYAQPPPIAYVPVLSEQTWAGRMGWVHRAVMQDFPDLSGHQVYACGSPLMVDAARRDFVQLCGLDENEFFSDSFLTEADLQ